MELESLKTALGGVHDRDSPKLFLLWNFAINIPSGNYL
jgi:hypothetical protein